jgi:hypothetical protein
VAATEGAHMNDTSTGPADRARDYEIRLQGQLDSRWATWFDGLSLTRDGDGTTVLTGPVTDQSALHGLLHKVRDLGLPLLSVTPVTAATSASSSHDPENDPIPTTRLTEENAMTTIHTTDHETSAPDTRSPDTTRATRSGSGRAPMTSLRKTALAAGAAYLASFVSIPTLFLYKAAHLPGFIAGPGPDNPILLGCVLEMIVALAGVATAALLFPVVKRQHEGVALAFVGTRILEGAAIVACVACLLSLVTLRQAGVGVEAIPTGQALATLYDRFFLLGQSTMPAVNALLLGSLLYRSRLVPRILPLIGLVGAPLLLAANGLVLFGVVDRVSTLTGLTVIPIAVWEFSLGVYLMVKGFKPSPITAGMTSTTSAVSASHGIS